MKTVEENLFEFCICTNDERALSECCYYIDRLIVPDGYKVKVTPVCGAKSMTEGYNSFMEKSFARYKVYLHQDLYILNRNFLEEVLKIFVEDEKIGLLGVLGSTKVADDASYYDSWNVGNVEAGFVGGVFQEDIGKDLFGDKDYIEVQAVDGMLMVTKYDILWRSDLNLGWDFYDVSQSMEFIKAGYKVVVPKQKQAWTFHDCGISKLNDYERCRKLILESYPEFFCEGYVSHNLDKIYEERKKIFNMLYVLYENNQWDSLLEVSGYLLEKGGLNLDTDTWYLVLMSCTYEEENKRGVKGSFAANGKTFWENKDVFIELKRLLRRIEQDSTEENITKMFSFLDEKELSEFALMTVGVSSITRWDSTMKEIFK